MHDNNKDDDSSSDHSDLPPDDLTELKSFNKVSLVQSLEKRYNQGSFYSFIHESILIAVNPCQWLDNGLYDMDSYFFKEKKNPHVYGIASLSFEDMILQNEYATLNADVNDQNKNILSDQSLIISGESGAGKTVTTSFSMNFLSFYSQQRQKKFKNRNNTRSDDHCKTSAHLQNGSTIEEKVIKSNPILESFGNASTIHNRNSSRFGKFIKLHFDISQNGRLVGASIETYLLEKNRVSCKNAPNYHIFYQLLAAAKLDSNIRDAYYFKHYNNIQDFRITQLYKENELHSADDNNDSTTFELKYTTNEFKDLNSSMKLIGFGENKRSQIFSVVAALLHASNLSFNVKSDDASEIDSENPHLEYVVKLLGLRDKRSLEDKLSFFTITAFKGRNRNASFIRRSRPIQAAQKNLNSWIVSIYATLFDYIVKDINDYIYQNDTIKKVDKKISFIGILDIFGFENFPYGQNSFEQLCINYCNEALQRQFIQIVFKNERDLYQNEGIILFENTEYPDNQDILDLIEAKGYGLLSLLDDQCKIPGSTDVTYANQIYKICRRNNLKLQMDSRQLGSRMFSIHHYACTVEYNINSGFIEKNKDDTSYEALEILNDSCHEIVKSLSKKIVQIQQKTRNKNKTVGSYFKKQLQNLMRTINQTTPRYIRCLKPNNRLSPDEFNFDLVSGQLKYSGVFEAVRMIQSGYPHRYTHKQFFDRYKVLIKNLDDLRNSSILESCETLLSMIQKDFCRNLSTIKTKDFKKDAKSSIGGVVGVKVKSKEQHRKYDNDFLLGITKVFLRQNSFDRIEQLRLKILNKAIVLFQATIRGCLLRQQYQNKLKNIIKIQCFARKCLATRNMQARKAMTLLRVKTPSLRLNCNSKEKNPVIPLVNLSKSNEDWHANPSHECGHLKANYQDQLVEFIDHELNSLRRVTFNHKLDAYFDKKINLMELLLTAEATLSSRPDLLSNFPLLVHENDRQKASAYLSFVSLARQDDSASKYESESLFFDAPESARLESQHTSLLPTSHNLSLRQQFIMFRQEFESRNQELREEFTSLIKNQQLQISTNSWRYQKKIDTLPEDSFSFIMVEPKSIASVMSLCVFFLQVVSYILCISDLESDGKSVLDIPPGVEQSVTVSQGISICLIILVQDNLWSSSIIFTDGNKTDVVNQGISYSGWIIGNSLRFFESLVMVLTSMILIVQQSTAIDLFKDFSAMTFISQLDNIVFVLGKMGYLGLTTRKVVGKVADIHYEKSSIARSLKYSNVYIRSLRRLVRYLIVVLILVGCYVFWIAECVIPQRNGDFLEHAIFVQLHNELVPQISHHSGTYILAVGEKRDGRHIFVEQGNFSIGNRVPAIIRFCSRAKIWVFTYMHSVDKNLECKNYFVKSENVKDRDTFDFVNPSIKWKVLDDFQRFIPIKDFSIIPNDSEIFIDLFSRTNNKFCNSIVTNELLGSFIRTRIWPHSYDILRDDDNNAIEVYKHYVFYSNSSSKADQWDVIVFLGSSWALLSSEYITEPEIKIVSLSDLANYLKNYFHATWSAYKVAFFSETVLIYDAGIHMVPSNLKWYIAIEQREGSMQQADFTQKVNAALICKECNNAINPCYYDATCLSDYSCDCVNGSNGTLCQIPPIKNGLCNPYFNKPAFNYDGGDCCLITCVSSNEYSCGIDSSTSSYVGYSNCKDPTVISPLCGECWIKVAGSFENFDFLESLSLKLSSNGGALFIASSDSNLAFVVEQDGSQWKERRQLITDFEQIRFGHHFGISVPSNSYNVDEIMTPMTIALGSSNVINVFDWNIVSASWHNVYSFKQLDSNITYIGLHKEGHLLSYLDDNCLSILHKEPFSPFEEKQKICSSVKYLSISDNGRNLLISHKNNSATYYILENDTYSIASQIQIIGNILGVQVANEEVIAFVVLNDVGKGGNIQIYRKNEASEMNWARNDIPIQESSIDLENSSLAISNDGAQVCINFANNTVGTFSWDGDKWERFGNLIKGSKFAVSADSSTLIVYNSRSKEKLQTFRNSRIR